MEQLQEFLHFLQTSLGIVAGVFVLYVAKKILEFRVEFMKELDEKFVAKDVFEVEKESIGRTLDRLWKKVFGSNGG